MKKPNMELQFSNVALFLPSATEKSAKKTLYLQMKASDFDALL